jgi:hypothetical protein
VRIRRKPRIRPGRAACPDGEEKRREEKRREPSYTSGGHLLRAFEDYQKIPGRINVKVTGRRPEVQPSRRRTC